MDFSEEGDVARTMGLTVRVRDKPWQTRGCSALLHDLCPFSRMLLSLLRVGRP